jgi:hypothetical protein
MYLLLVHIFDGRRLNSATVKLIKTSIADPDPALDQNGKSDADLDHTTHFFAQKQPKMAF